MEQQSPHKNHKNQTSPKTMQTQSVTDNFDIKIPEINYASMYTDVVLTPADIEKYVTMMKKRISSEQRRSVTSLTALEYQKALFEARQRIYYDKTVTAAYWQRVREVGSKVPQLTWQQMEQFVAYKFVTETGKKLRLTKYNRKIFRLLCKYFTASPAFEQPGFSLQKGLLLMGPVGCGKTTMLRMFRDNQYACFTVKSCLQISESYLSYDSNTKRDILEYHSNLLKNPVNTNVFRKSELGTCFDDLGIEDVKHKFGNETNVMAYILTRRYDTVPFHFTHVTSNKSLDDIKDFYGHRLHSRMSEMFNLIIFPTQATDFRKINPVKFTNK